MQALRAVAVLGVVTYHLWPFVLPGGFVGVDVFFVISGFLITSLLWEEGHSTGRVSLTRFWARRIRRILPAAFIVLFVCVLLVVVAMPRVAWRTNLVDIRAAAAYFVNWQLGANAVDYLASSNSPTVVQHYWSLSVEEQFYLAWPLLVLAAFWISRRARRPHPDLWLGVILGLATTASFITSIIWTSRQPAMAFFATPTRAWEFAVGGLVAIALRRPSVQRGRAATALSMLGMALIVYSLVAISRHDAFPGAIAAVPVIGAALVIAGGTARDPALVYGWMDARPVQWVGDNSYSIYLWHWPLIVVVPWITHGPLRAPDKLAILAASLLLAAVSKRVIEDPVRAGSFWRGRRWPAYSLAAVGVVAVLGICADFTSMLNRSEHHAELTARVRSAALVKRPHVRSCFGAAAMVPANHCRAPFIRPKDLDTEFAAADGWSDPCLQADGDPPTPRFCVYGATRHPRQVLAVVGNSHAWRLIPALSLYAQRHNWEIIEASRTKCLGLITRPAGPGGASANCLSWTAQVEHHFLAMHRLTGVIFASYQYWQGVTLGPNPTTREVAGARAQVVAMWRRYQEAGKQVLVVQDVPGMRPTLDPQCIQQSLASADPCSVPAARVVHPTLLTELAQTHPSLASYVPIDQYFCSAGRCHGLIGGVVVYFDQQHLTTTYARTLAEFLGAAIHARLGRPSVPASSDSTARSAGPVSGTRAAPATAASS